MLDNTLEIVSPQELASDFRYALDVMEESNHLGLDDEHALLLHGILQRRIDEALTVFSGTPARRAQLFRLPIESEQSL
jgi:hypothetical protein